MDKTSDKTIDLSKGTYTLAALGAILITKGIVARASLPAMWLDVVIGVAVTFIGLWFSFHLPSALQSRGWVTCAIGLWTALTRFGMLEGNEFTINTIAMGFIMIIIAIFVHRESLKPEIRELSRRSIERKRKIIEKRLAAVQAEEAMIDKKTSDMVIFRHSSPKLQKKLFYAISLILAIVCVILLIWVPRTTLFWFK